jgi:two-component system sensor histidine kinase KdpD
MALIGDLEQVPRTRVAYRGVEVEEMDVDAIVARHPQVAIVDELAHTNVPGSRHAKRWEDVRYLLDEGINVISAMNVQHLESLNDVLERELAIAVRETVPDWIVAQADQVVNVDLSAEDLRQRLREGKIYGMERVPTALANFFTDDNLSTLRELALREVASSVDRSREELSRRERPSTRRCAMSIASWYACRAKRGSRESCCGRVVASPAASTPTGTVCTCRHQPSGPIVSILPSSVS